MKSITSVSSGQNTDYNSIAKEYDILEKNAVTLWYLGYRPLIKYLNTINNKSVLDYGCGSGIFCRFLSENKANVTGVDITANMITVAKEGDLNAINYHQITSGNLDFLPEGSFDFVVSNFVLCTISTRQEIMKIMFSIHRVLKNEGEFFILNTNWDKSNGKEFISFRLNQSINLSSGDSVTAIIKAEPPIILKDYFWSQADYNNLLFESGFNTQCIYEPLAQGKEIQWISEESFPPYYIIQAKKQISEVRNFRSLSSVEFQV